MNCIPLIFSLSSFGHMNLAEKRDQASKADLARSTLVTVLNNIGSISMMCARTEVTTDVLLVDTSDTFSFDLECRSNRFQWKFSSHQ